MIAVVGAKVIGRGQIPVGVIGFATFKDFPAVACVAKPFTIFPTDAVTESRRRSPFDRAFGEAECLPQRPEPVLPDIHTEVVLLVIETGLVRRRDFVIKLLPPSRD